MEDYLVFPEYLLLIFLIVPGAFLAIVLMMRSRLALKLWFSQDDYRMFLPEFRLMLRILGFFLLLVALLSPYWGRQEQSISKMSREIYITLDISASMNVADIEGGRLNKIKKDLKAFVNLFRGDQLGLIVFTTDAYVQCPLTDDTRVVNMLLDVVGSEQFASTGTDFRAALTTALERFTHTEKSARNTARAIVLISDGEDFGENYTSAIERLKAADITVFPVGVGTLQGGQVPVIRDGQVVDYKKTEEGTPAISRLKEETLQMLAEQFGTQYTRIDEPGDDLLPVADQIRLMTASEIDKKVQLAKVNRYQWFLGFAILCLGIAQVISPVRRPSRLNPVDETDNHLRTA